MVCRVQHCDSIVTALGLVVDAEENEQRVEREMEMDTQKG